MTGCPQLTVRQPAQHLPKSMEVASFRSILDSILEVPGGTLDPQVVGKSKVPGHLAFGDNLEGSEALLGGSEAAFGRPRCPFGRECWLGMVRFQEKWGPDPPH